MGEVPSQSLVQSLIDVVDDISSIGEFRRIHKKESCNLARRVKLLAPLFEEIKEFKGPLPDEAISCFNALEKALHSAKLVLRLCHDGSKLFVVMEKDEVAKRFQSVTAELVQALDRLPYHYLDVSDEVREQVDLVHNQFKRAKGRIDVQDVQLVADIQSVLMTKVSKDPDSAVLERLGAKLELRTKSAVRQEQKALHRMRKVKELDDENFNIMSDILDQLLIVAEIDAPQSMSGASDGSCAYGRIEKVRLATAEQSTLADIPDEYRCPISLEPMRDPVILASGQTYERACIQKWLDEGKRTCPITRGLLSHHNLTPNYVLRSLIAQWCESHGIEAPKRTSKSSRAGSYSSSEASKDAACVRDLLIKLTSMEEDEQRIAAGELRLLAKRSDENRVCIAKAGAIPLLVKLLRTQDLRTQEHAVTALLNLSINDINKGAIVLAGAIHPIVEVLKSGSMEARENAAATLFSLSVPDDHKVTIGASGAIPALVDLLKGGTARGKKDAATALFNLSIYVENKARAVRAGVVPPLMELLVDPNAGMVDEALAILAILATHHDGRMAIGQASAIPTLVELIRSGSARNKENAAAILLALGMSDPANVSLATKLGAYTPLTELSQTGTTRAKRKSSQLLEQMKKLSLETSFGLSNGLSTQFYPLI